MAQPQHFVIFLVHDFSHLAFSCAIEPLRIANMVHGEILYKWSLASSDGVSASCSNGTVSLVHHAIDEIPNCDQLLVLSGLNVAEQCTPALCKTVARAAKKSRALGALCSGAWVLAKAGLLKGQGAAIHWDFHDAFVEQFPEVRLVQGVFDASDKIVTASGGTATADLMLHLIEQSHGEELALAVADQMVYNAARDGGAAQKASLQSHLQVRNAHLTGAIELMKGALDEPIPIAEIAARLNVSKRHLERVFARYLQRSPKKYFLDMRLRRAQRLLVQTDASVTDVAVACGFESMTHFSRMYKAAFGVSPSKQGSKLQ